MSRIGFLILGAQKAGTTSLFEHLRRHPEIHMPPEKEVAFFSSTDLFDRGPAWYEATITRGARPDAVCGEASTHYMNGTPFGDLEANATGAVESVRDDVLLEDVIPRRIKGLLPNVRLICVLRDPVDRAYSHYRMMVLERAESRTFADAAMSCLDPTALLRARTYPTLTNAYVATGEYGRIIAGYLRHFPSDQLLTIFSDDLSAQPLQSIAALYEHIGVATDFVPDSIDTRYRTAAEKERIPLLSLDRLQRRLARMRLARSSWHALPTPIRHRIDRHYNVADYRLGMWNAKRGDPATGPEPAIRAELMNHYRSDGNSLQELLMKEVPWLARWDGA